MVEGVGLSVCRLAHIATPWSAEDAPGGSGGLQGSVLAAGERAGGGGAGDSRVRSGLFCFPGLPATYSSVADKGAGDLFGTQTRWIVDGEIT
jgi:hypothetical protein